MRVHGILNRFQTIFVTSNAKNRFGGFVSSAPIQRATANWLNHLKVLTFTPFSAPNLWVPKSSDLPLEVAPEVLSSLLSSCETGAEYKKWQIWGVLDVSIDFWRLIILDF